MSHLTKQTKRKVFSALGFSLLFIVLIKIMYQPLHIIYDEEDFYAIHTVLELFSIFASFSIGMYGWKAYDNTRTLTFLWIPPIFLAVGFFDLLHTLTYPGMPTFSIVNNSNVPETIWFWIVARLTASIGMFCMLLSKERLTTTNNRYHFVIGTVLYSTIVTCMILFFGDLLPTLIHNNNPTFLKVGLEYFACVFYFLSALVSLRRYKTSNDPSDIDLFLAFSFFIISEILLTIYTSITDLNIVFAHVFKVIGSAFIFKSFYFTKIQQTFEHQQKAENSLKATQNLLESFFNNTPDSIIITDTNGMILRANTGFKKIFGLKEDDIIGKFIFDVLPFVSEQDQNKFAAVLSGHSLIGLETCVKRLDGEEIFVSTTVSPVTDENGEIINISAISRDISSQKRSVQRIREAEQELFETVQKQQGVIFKYKKFGNRFVHILCDGVLLHDMGFTPEQIVGKSIEENLSLSEATFLNEYYERAWSGEEVSFEFELSERTCFISLNPIKRNGQVIEVIGSGLDISQLKRTEELLQKSEKLAVVGELAAGLAHEIRNPLTTLKGFTQLIKSKTASGDDYYIDIMLSELDRIELITNELMVVAKPQVKKYQREDAKLLINQVMAFSAPHAKLNNVNVTVSFETEETIIYCDGNQIKQVFINLIKNAFEAMPKGGNLTIQVKQKDQFLHIDLHDTGIGIPKSLITRLGEPFYTLKEKGTGLGLMVSFRIIEAHKGTIHFTSEENIGTTVSITLPLVTAHDNFKTEHTHSFRV